MVGVSTSNSDYVDLLAERGSEAIVSELKGHPSSPGLDDAIGYGQSLRRMDPGQASVRYSLVVPPTLRTHVTRVLRDVLHAGCRSVRGGRRRCGQSGLRLTGTTPFGRICQKVSK